MAVSIIVGGHFGSEGKGKVAHYFAKEKKASIAVRVGGPNSGHTVINEDGDTVILRILPTASILPNVKCVLTAGSYINTKILKEEIEKIGLEENRLIIDPNAIIIANKHALHEINQNLIDKIGSTASGVGAAILDRVSRSNNTLLAKNEPTLSKYISNTKTVLREAINNDEHIIIEGTQGYGLSLLHSPFYPYVTSRDTTAAAFLAETGLSPLDVENVILVIRAFPIRVSGNSGPLPKEIDWDILTKESGSKDSIIEHTSATNRIRRVARFDSEIVNQAIIANNPNIIVLNHIDYIKNYQEQSYDFIKKIEEQLQRKIDLIGASPSKLVREL